MITDNDVKKLKEVFATKEELKKTKDDIVNTLSKDILTVIEMVGEVSQKLTDVIDKFDKKSIEQDEMLENHERRLDKVEDKVFPTI